MREREKEEKEGRHWIRGKRGKNNGVSEGLWGKKVDVGSREGGRMENGKRSEGEC